MCKNKVYIVRDEGWNFIKSNFPFLDEDTCKTLHNEFKTSFSNLLSQVLPKNIKIEFVPLKAQVEEIKKQLKNQKTISLDSCFEGDYNIRTSRLFPNEHSQKSFIRIIGTNGTIEEQIKNIPAGHYVIVEDDSIAQETVRTMIKELKDNEYLSEKVKFNEYYNKNSLLQILGYLRRDIIIDDLFILNNYIYKKYKKETVEIVDVVDMRDFMIGFQNSGLLIDLNGIPTRCPYISPIVNLTTRASIPLEKSDFFSKSIVKINDMFSKL